MSEANITKQMIYEKVKAVKDMNFIDGFEPLEYMRKIDEDKENPKWYLDVKYRILWFRLCNTRGKISTKIFSLSEKCAVVEAKIYLDYKDAIEHYISSAMSQKNIEDSPSYLEWAETAAIGRALSNAGFGIQFCDRLEGNDIQPTESGVDIEKLSSPKSTVPEISTNRTNSNASTIIAGRTSVINVTPIENNVAKNFEEAMNKLSLEQCKDIKVTFGQYAGKKLGQVSVEDPGIIKWIVERYVGKDFMVKAAATKLYEKALQQAS